VITNSGKLEASIKGSAVDATAIALQVGPIVVPVDEDEEGGEQEGLAVGVITITNSGTIAATNEAGASYGIYAEDASDPLVINQQGGVISGSTAIEIGNGNADTLNWSGGLIKGLVSADAKDVVNVLQALGKDGKGVATTVTAGTDFALDGAGQLNVGGGKGAPVTFDFAGKASNVGATTLATGSALVVQPTGEIQGNTFTMQPDSKVTFVFTPADAGLITMTGDAAIDGTLGAVALPGLYGDKGSHVVIDSDTKVVGTFDNVAITGDTLLLDFSAAVHAQDVTISWERTAFDDVDGLSDNSAAVAGALEDGYDPTRPASKNTPELNDQLKGLFTLTDAAKYDRVLNSWSGSEHAQVMRAAANLSEPYLMAIGEHLNDNRNSGFREQNVVMLRPKGSSGSIAPASSVGASGAEETGFAVWGRAFGRWADTRGDANADGFDEDTFGAVLGVDFQVTPTILLGIAGSYTNDDIGFDDGDDAEIERWTIGGYASATFNAFYIDASFTYASDDYEVNRTIVTGGVACLAYNCSTGAASKYDGDGLIVHAEAGFNWVLGEGVRLQPFAGLNYTGMDTDAFGEVGGGDLGLQVLDGTGKSFQSRLGARLSGEWGDGDVKWVPELRAEWRHEFEDQPAWIVSNLVGLPDDPFLTVGSHVSGDLAVIGAGITAQMANGWGFYLDYQGAFASGYSSHAIQGGARFRF
jgi:outer membrane autotransporter protein